MAHKLRRSLSLLVLFVFTANLLFPYDLRAQNQGSLKSTFANLKSSLGEVVKHEVNKDLDDALSKAFDPLPEEIKRSNVAVEKLDSRATEEAIKFLASTPVQEPMLPTQDKLNIEYDQLGVALSLALWHGTKLSLTNLFRNVITQIHGEDELENFRLVVNSSPVPSISISDVDFNDELRAQKELEAKRYPINTGEPAKTVFVPRRMGLEIVISSGMLATLANVDEFAGQIYKALALKNPKLYGVTQDPRFARNQQYLALLSQIVDESPEDVKKEAHEKKEMIMAELSAMDRLAASGFNPWAVHHYEERIFSWIADVFLKNPSHGFGRWLISDSVYNISDWSRPFRIQIQEAYMYHLINSGRVLNKSLKNTEFSSALKFVRLRMKLFTKPFYSGVVAQTAGLGLMLGASYASTSYAELAHWALSAVNQTTSDFMQWFQNITFHEKFAGKVGEYVSETQRVSQQILDHSYFGFDMAGVGEALIKTTKDFLVSYETGLMVGGAAIAAAAMVYLIKALAPIFQSAARHIEDERTKSILAQNEAELNRKNIDIEKTSDEKIEPRLKPLHREYEQAKQKVDLVMGQKQKIPWSIRSERIGKGIAEFLTSFKNGSVSLYESSQAQIDETTARMGRRYQNGKFKIAQFISSTGTAAHDGYFFAVRKTKAAGSYAGNKTLKALQVFAEAGAAASRATSRATVSGTTRAWHTLGRIARETPGEIERSQEKAAEIRLRNADKVKQDAMAEADAYAEMLISFGHGTVSATKMGLKITKSSGKFILITAPVAITGGSIAAVIGTSKWTAQKYQNISQSLARVHQARREKKDLQKKAAIAQKAQDLRLEQERIERIKQGEIRRREFFESNTHSLSEIFTFMKLIYAYTYSPSDSERQEAVKPIQAWGFDKPGFLRAHATVYPADFFLPALKKWLAKAKEMKLDSPTHELREMSTLLDTYYSTISLSARLDKELIQVGMEFYELVMGVKFPEDKLSYNIQNNRVRTGIFLDHMEMHYKKKMALQPNRVANRVKVFISTKIADYEKHLLKILGDDLYKNGEKDFVRFLVDTRDSETEVRMALGRASEYVGMYKRQGGFHERFSEAVDRLNAFEKVKIYLTAKRAEAGTLLENIAGAKALKTMQKASAEVVEMWVTQSRSVKELTQRIERDSQFYDLEKEHFSLLLRNAIMARPEVITSRADLDLLFANNYFWPHHNSAGQTTALEKPLHELLKMKRQQFADSPAWKYDPIFAEKIHTILKKRLEDLNQFPSDFEGLESIWKIFSSRGVSTVTDRILAQLLKMGSIEQINRLEEYAVKEGRVFDQGLRDEFAIRQVRSSPEYQDLMKMKDASGVDRKAAISEVIRVAQANMSDLGIRYVELLEEISVGIKSTYEEAQQIHEAKTRKLQSLGDAAAASSNDSRSKMLRDILPHIKTWKQQQQFEFLLYLRGSIEATPFIEAQFPTFGPERIRQIFQSLPTDAAMLIINLYLSETLLANNKRSFGQKKDLMAGYGKKLIAFLVDQGADEKVKHYSRLFLSALLKALEEVGNEAFQKQVLSALIAMKPKQDNSIGETLKMILEQFPGVGPKIGQFTVATRLLSKPINDVLEKTQDQTLPPSRFTMYGDLEQIVGKGRMNAIAIDKLEGGGSIKYTFSATEVATMNKLVFQVFREEVQNAAGLYIEVLNHAIDELIRTGGPEWAFLRVIVDGAMNAVKRERQFRREATKTNVARLRLYSQFSDADFTIMVPEQDVLNERLLMAALAKGVSFNKLSQEDKNRVGLKLLEMEKAVLFSEGRPVVWYDTDRHAGNYIIEVTVVNGQKHYKIWPIDFGQLTYIRTDQRDKIAEMFGIAGILDKMGSNDSLVQKVAALFDIKGEDLKRLHKNLALLFPLKMKSGPSNDTGFIRPYFTLIAAINTSLDPKEKDARHRDLQSGKLDFAYTDFVRAIIQLNQYEKQIVLPAGSQTPRQILETAAKDFGWKHMQSTKLGTKQSLGLTYLNTRNQIRSMMTGEEYTKIDMRMSREDFDKLTMADQGKAAEVKPQAAKKAVRCRLLFR